MRMRMFAPRMAVRQIVGRGTVGRGIGRVRMIASNLPIVRVRLAAVGVQMPIVEMPVFVLFRGAARCDLK